MVLYDVQMEKSLVYSDTQGISVDNSNVEIYQSSFEAKQSNYYYEKHLEIAAVNGFFLQGFNGANITVAYTTFRGGLS